MTVDGYLFLEMVDSGKYSKYVKWLKISIALGTVYEVTPKRLLMFDSAFISSFLTHSVLDPSSSSTLNKRRYN